MPSLITILTQILAQV